MSSTPETETQRTSPPSLIIPAYNEAARIGRVLDVAVSSGLFSQIIVVDDASSDGTAEAAGGYSCIVVRHETNRGKAQAMLTGLQHAQGEIIAFIDADLLGVTAEHLDQLVAPVRDLGEKAVLAVFSGGRMATTLAQKITPMISGQRCLRRELFDDFDGWNTRFGIETALNDHILKRGVRQQIVQWPGAAQVMKEEKRGLIAGFGARLRMYWEILVVWLRSRFSR
ncbi:glycosyltransferase family 2 protein [bacterium]|nr:glycosyltransferase family 2 protein [bacterium]